MLVEVLVGAQQEAAAAQSLISSESSDAAPFNNAHVALDA
jgi:hypothetical protein